MVRLGIVLAVVDAEHDGQVFVRGGRGDDDLLDRALHVGLGLSGIGEVAGGFDDHLGAGRGPVQLGRVALGKYLQFLAIDRDVVIARGDGVGQVTQNGIIFEQVSQRCRAGQVVHRYKFDARIAERGPEHVAADAAKAIDANLYSHKLWNLLQGG